MKKVKYRMLDTFCGLGGASEGFHREGFDCTGIDIINVGYPYHFIKGDMNQLKGSDFRGYDVIWGSPPCRDFSVVGNVFGHTWKRPQDPEVGMKLVNAYLQFVKEADPTIWIMENVSNLQKHYKKAKVKTSLGDRHRMTRCFWGNFPPFLIPKQKGKVVYPGHWDKNPKRNNRPDEGPIFVTQGKLRKWERAKIPLVCSLAFAKACKTEIEHSLRDVLV